MKSLSTIFMVFAVVIIICCVFFSCCNFTENLENMKLDMPDVDCTAYSNDVVCGTYPQCQWSADKCVPNTLTERNISDRGPDTLPPVEGFQMQNKF